MSGLNKKNKTNSDLSELILQESFEKQTSGINDNYLVESVLEKQGEKLYDWKLRTGLDPPQVNADKQPQEVCELLQVTAEREEKA